MRRGWAMVVGSAMAACATREACPAGDLTLPGTGTPAFAVLRADESYASSAIAVLDGTGAVLEPDFVDTGSRVSTLVTAIPGDAALPSTPLGPRTIAWLDRFNYDVLTIVRDGMATEIDVRGEAPGTPHTGFSPNPQDALRLDDGRLLVSRLNPNPDPSAPELQRGNDVVVVTDGVVGARIDLEADGVLDDCTTGDCTAYAHPAAIVPLEAGAHRAALVVLERLAGGFIGGAGSGAVVAIDAGTFAVSPPLDLAPLENCQFASVDPDDASRAYVACTGVQTTGSEGRRPHAGIAEVSLDASGALVLGAVVQADAGEAVVGQGLIALGARRVLVVAREGSPEHQERPDHVLEIDVAAGTARDVFTARTGFVLGVGALAGDVALVPDADANAIRRFDVSGPATLVDSVVLDDCIDLPPRQIAPLSF